MIIKKEYKPSFHKANARFRGVTEHSQYTNFILESAHDLFLLSQLTTGNENTQIKGHEKEMYENFAFIMTGTEGIGRTNLFTSSSLFTLEKERIVPVPGIEGWSSLNGCTQTKTGNIFTLTSPGLLDPVGIYTTLYVESGEKLYIRLKARSQNGAPSFSFGSNNLQSNGEIGKTQTVTIPADREHFMTIDTILECPYSQSISLNINVHEDPSFLQSTTVEITELEIYYAKKILIQAASFDSSIKPTLYELEEKLNSIR